MSTNCLSPPALAQPAGSSLHLLLTIISLVGINLQDCKQSQRWRYSGECDAKNKFTGESFEIRPTKIAHLLLYLPKTFEGVENYPEAPLTNNDRVKEQYTWKKVTTVITNLILGPPVIYHYCKVFWIWRSPIIGLGERCVLTFKPRGWRGKETNKVKGSVFDQKGN
ncbi:Oxysterol-binding protein-domain-containing protein [Phakopsora pachyrhizi]|nr:Oxysterol-binding protein-domain-containing protein [Phakopsora pachyrhizi]